MGAKGAPPSRSRHPVRPSRTGASSPMLEKVETPETDAPAVPPQSADQPPRRGGGGGLFLLLVALSVLGAGIYWGIRARTSAQAALSDETVAAAVPTVEVVRPKENAPNQALVLPGQTTAFTDTPIYARASGYLKKWYVDIGAHVKKGELLAEIETPELDAQLRQARADLVTAQANAKLAGITANRTQDLLKSQSVS